MAAPVAFPGANIARADLQAYMQRCNEEFAAGNTPAELGRVYGGYNTLQYHDSFTRQLQQWQQPTIGAIATQCDINKNRCSLEALKWGRATVPCMAAGVVAGLGTIISLASIAPGSVVSSHLISAASFAAVSVTGFVVGSTAGRLDSKRRKIDLFEHTLKSWGRELSTGGGLIAAAPPAAAATVPSAAAAAPAPVTRALNSDEKLALAKQLLQEVEEAENKRIERDKGLKINGVNVPVRK